jgi:DNA-directed RNA polymerase specialized sigma24 family protein
MARDEDIDRRLNNWARWRASMNAGAGGNFATCDMTQERVDGGGYDAPMVVPVLDDEAQVTELAVQALDVGQRDAVFAFYVSSGGAEQRARRIGVAVPTMYARVDLAHKRLQIWLAERAQMQREQRSRLEKLQASARPGGGGFST